MYCIFYKLLYISPSIYLILWNAVDSSDGSENTLPSTALGVFGWEGAVCVCVVVWGVFVFEGYRGSSVESSEIEPGKYSKKLIKSEI